MNTASRSNYFNQTAISNPYYWEPSNKESTSTFTNEQTITPRFHAVPCGSSSPMQKPKPKTLLNTTSKKIEKINKIKVQECMICKSTEPPDQTSLG